MLSDQIEFAKKLVKPCIPPYITTNLTKQFDIRPYQEEALKNYLVYDQPELRKSKNQVLFHMATGSGKTFIMAALILHLFKNGYRNFLFFVHLDNILQKTRDNFLNKSSPKYLFADKIVIDGNTVEIREVNNFAESDPNSINIIFTTIQGLHSAYTNPRENTLSFFESMSHEVVYISDEAHHLSVDTKCKKDNRKDADNKTSWQTVINQYFSTNKKNVLLEFTATIDLNNRAIKEEYDDKIIFQYDLKRFRKDGYSKEVDTLCTDLNYLEMGMLALILSQYRLKMFNSLKKNIKPTVLFKSRTIDESNEYYESIRNTIDNLTGKDLEKYFELDLEVLRKARRYFSDNNVSLELLAQEIKEGFSDEHCAVVNEKTKKKVDYVMLNTLESKNNPLRAIFEVDRLDEGWDVLNLFDIVRLYDTRDARNGVPGSTTIQEAQLIGRGARYCPFVTDDIENKYKRKFDSDLDNPYRLCETMYYHCKTNSRYIDELRTALIRNGMLDPKTVKRHIVLKEAFKKTDLYNNGFVFVNDQQIAKRDEVTCIPSPIRDKTYTYSASGRNVTYAILFEERSKIVTEERIHHKTTIATIAETHYNVVNRALHRFPYFSFSNIKKLFPSIKTLREFITSPNYLGDISIEITSDEEELSNTHLYEACLSVFNQLSDSLSVTDVAYTGTTEFRRVKVSELFIDKIVEYTDPKGDGKGIPQAESGEYRLDLSTKDWYVFNENYGTSEEKAFVKFFNQHYAKLKEFYDEIYLVRNERHMHIYSFNEGKRFEPDFLLFLRRKGTKKDYDLIQTFIEPKGNMLLEQDKWKQEFLLQIREKWIDAEHAFFDDTEYMVVGLPFFNIEHNKEFENAFETLVSDTSRVGFQ